jgi:hypothetical protein
MRPASTSRLNGALLCTVFAVTAVAGCRGDRATQDTEKVRAAQAAAAATAATERAPEASAPSAAAESAAAAEAQPQFPPPLFFVSPKPGATVCLPASIDTRFKLNDAMVINGRFDPNAFTVYMDGKNIMRDVEFFPSQTFPQTHVAVLHAMWVYDPGPHTARIEFVGDDGPTAYEWTFDIGADCPPRLF